MERGKTPIIILKFLKNRISIITVLTLAIMMFISFLIIKLIESKNSLWFFCLIFLNLLVCGMGITLLLNLYRYIFNPLNEIFDDMGKMGITKLDSLGRKPANMKLLPAIPEIEKLYHKLKSLIMLIENVNNTESFYETLKYVYSSFSTYIPYHYIGIALINNDGKSLKAFNGISNGSITDLPQKLLGYEIDIHETSLKRVLESGSPRLINDLEKYVHGKPVKEYNKILLESGIRSSVTLPLKINEKPIGVIFFSSTKKNVYHSDHINFLNTLANSIAISFNKNIVINDLLYSSTIALAKLAESRDKDTGGHLQRISVYSGLIAQFLYFEDTYEKKITPEFIHNIKEFSPLHDIGKVAIQDNILLKPDKLTTEEFNTMKTHAIFGAWILKQADDNTQKNGRRPFKMGIEIAESHHEKWDGTGYPFGKKGEEIPLSARIVALVDVFDALTSKRPYKKAFSFEKAYEIILEGSGTHFDPKIIQVFLENKDRIYEEYKKFYDIDLA